MPYHQFIWPTAVAFVLWCGSPTTTSRHPATSLAEETAFLAESDAAMTTMMNGMTVQPAGDTDQDFAAMMVAHHQGAIDMATAELRHGTNELLRRIAQEIIVDQMQEIVAMQLAAGTPLSPSHAAPTGSQPASLTATQPPSLPVHTHGPRTRDPAVVRSDSSKTWEFVE
jgi:hypothetical protein